MLAILSSAYFLGTLLVAVTVITGSLWEARADIAGALGLRMPPADRTRSARIAIKRRVRLAPRAAQAWRAAA